MGWVEMLCWVRILGRGCWGRDAQGGWGEDAALSDLYHSSIAGKAPSLREVVLRVPSFLKHKALPVTTPAMSPRSNLGLRRHIGGAGSFSCTSRPEWHCPRGTGSALVRLFPHEPVLQKQPCTNLAEEAKGQQ